MIGCVIVTFVVSPTPFLSQGTVTEVVSAGAGLYVMDGTVGLCLAYQPPLRRELRAGDSVQVRFVYVFFPACLTERIVAGNNWRCVSAANNVGLHFKKLRLTEILFILLFYCSD